MRIIVSDTSCLIDLHKANVLEEMVAFPVPVVVPEPLFSDEVLSFGESYKQRLTRLGLRIDRVPSAGVSRAQQLFNLHRALKIHDCFALAIAENEEKSLLLTGDKKLSSVAKTMNVRTHGVLWAFDQLHKRGLCDIEKLRVGLEKLLHDPLVFIPNHLIQSRLDDKFK